VSLFFVAGVVACDIGFEQALLLPPLLGWRRHAQGRRQQPAPGSTA
jgi:hypothetical protein